MSLSKPKRVLVCGGRDCTDQDFVWGELDKLHTFFGFKFVIEGGARGVDSLAGGWATQRGLINLKFPAEWERLGRGAGHARNKEMLVKGKPDMVIVFPGGKGTNNMRETALKHGVPVLRFCLDPGKASQVWSS